MAVDPLWDNVVLRLTLDETLTDYSDSAHTVQMVTGSIEDQARCVLENVKGVVEGSGFTMQQIVKTTVFATSMDFFAAVNGVYAEYFGENPPARSFVAVKELPKGAQVEIEVVAAL